MGAQLTVNSEAVICRWGGREGGEGGGLIDSQLREDLQRG